MYEASLEIPGVLSLDVLRVVETGLAADRSYEALIGRDVLARCVFNYDGPSATATLSSPTKAHYVPPAGQGGAIARFWKWMTGR